MASLCDKCEKVYVCAKRKKKNKKKPICKNCKKNVLNKTKILQEGGKYPPPVISDGVGSKVKKQPEVIDIDGDDREDIQSPLQTRGQRRSKAEGLKSSNSSKSSKSSEKSRAVIKQANKSEAKNKSSNKSSKSSKAATSEKSEKSDESEKK